MHIRITLSVTFFFLVSLGVNAQKIHVLYHPTESPEEYTNRFHHTSIQPYGVYGLASFEVNPWIYDLRSQRAYRVMETEGNCALLAVFKDYLAFSENKKLCLNTPVGNGLLHIVDVLEFSGRYMLIYAIQDKATQQNTLYVQDFNQDLTLAGTPRKLFTMTGFIDDGITLMRTSPNKQYMAFIQGDPDHSMNRNHRRAGCTVFDDSFNIVWQKDFDLSPYEGILTAMELDNAGNMHILREATGKDIEAGLHSYFWRAEKQANAVLGNPSHLNFGYKLKVLNGTATVAGFFKERRNIGYFLYQSDTAAHTVREVDRAVPNDQTYLSKRLAIREMVALASGDVVFSAEWDICSFNGPYRSCSSGPVTIISWNGAHRWQRTLYKHQNSHDRSRGYTMIPYNNSVLFVYNDHPDNILTNPSEQKVAHYYSTNSIVMMQTLDRDGNATKAIITLPRGSSKHRLVASGFPPIVPGKLYKVKVLEGDTLLDGVLAVE